MRPRRLSMQAFGPFAKRQVIDFDALGQDPLFLIHGPTGAGKTSILDAICFALYGETTGAERKGGQMRCDLAEPATLTEVVLDFELAGKCYRARRIPEQARPKSRGEGTTEQKPEAQLWEIDEGVELEDAMPPPDRSRLLVPKKVTDATAKVAEITGLSADQFRQVMVLPQGKFRQLLIAETSDREKIFAELFQTHVYEKVEASLKEEALVIERRVKVIQAERKSILDFVEIETVERLAEEIANKRREKEAAEATRNEAEKIANAAQARFAAAELLAAKFAELREAQRRLEALDGQAEVIEERRAVAKRLAATRDIHVPNDKRVEAQRQEGLARAALERASRRLAEESTKLEKAKRACEAIEERKVALAQLERTHRELVSYEARARAVEVAESRLTAARGTLERTSAEEARRLGVVEKYGKALGEGEAELAAIRQQVEPLPEMEQRLTRAQKLVTDQGALGETRSKRDQALRARDHAEREFKTAAATHAALDAAWRAGQATILADALAEGEACPVCGSEHHPGPAHSEESLPSQVDVERAREALEQKREVRDAARHTLASCERDVSTLEARIEETRAELGDAFQPDPALLEQARQALATEVAALREKNEEIPKRVEALARAGEQLETATSEHESARLALQTATTDATAAKERHDLALQELPEAYRAPGVLKAETEQVGERHRALDESIKSDEKALAKANEDHVRAETDSKSKTELLETSTETHRVAAKVWQRLLDESDFADQSDFDRARAQIDGLEALEREIREFDDRRLAARTTVNDKSAAIEGETDPELEPIRAAHEEAKNTRASCEKALHDCVARLKQLEVTSAKLEASARDQRQREEAFKRIGTIAAVANGRNAHNLSLQRFVLAVLLDDVLRDADLRLSRMTRGRYRLIRKEDLTHRGKKAGLDLEVEDGYTGKSRDVATLSGGESFMAALALALGLSDVVQAYAGGIRLDALFIDEGFGSLDPESLELAVEALLALQASGRMVGVISHVAELKERIDVRVELVADERGSHARLVVP